MNRSVRGIFAVTMFGGVIAAIGAIALVVAGQRPSHAWLPVLFAAAAAIGELATIDGDAEEGDQAFSFATTAHLAAAMLLPAGWAALAAGLGSATGEVVSRARPHLVALNASLATFCTLAGGAAFHAVEDGHTFGGRSYFAIAVMLLVYVPLNLTPPGLVAMIMSSQTMRPLAWLPPADFFAYLMEACLAAAITVVLTANSWFLLFLAPLLAAAFLALKRSRLLAREARNALRALVTIIDAKDPSTAAHSERVGDLAARLGEAVGLGTRHVRELRWAGRLHDIGKVAVDDAVLRKAGPLTSVEWELMRRHPAVSAEVLETLSVTRHMTPAVRYHHERADGDGYYRLPGAEVPLEASIIAVVDAFDAMTTTRPYRPGTSFDEALGRIEAASGTHFDPAVAAAFVAMMQGRRVEPVVDEADGLRGALRQRLRDVRRARGNMDTLGSERRPLDIGRSAGDPVPGVEDLPPTLVSH